MKQGFFTKKRILAGAIVLVVVLLAAGGIYAAQTLDKITNNQMDLFNQTQAPTEEATPTPAATPTVEPSGTTDSQSAEPSASPTPTPTIDPLQNLQEQADQSFAKDTLHILLIGVDYAAERKNWMKNFNSDVMLLLAINFKQNKVDMISFPRDTYAKIANIDGFYKLNFALTAGGGTNDKGFMNVCKSVEGMLDKKLPPINYYIAVTMSSVKELTDAVGGVDYNVDIDFKINGRAYKKGMQHMNGQAVLDYCRVRKNSGTGYISEDLGDLNRVNRQKMMLVAVFKKLKSTASLLDVPRILTSMQGKTFTNLNFNQLAALALFAKDLPDNKISMNTMQGYEKGNIFNWKFVLTYQEKRVALIKKVYGVSVAPQYKYDEGYARVLWAYMQGEAWLKEINKWLAKDAALPADKKKFTNVDDMNKLRASITVVQNMMNKYRLRLFKDTKPSFSANEYKEAETDVLNLQKIADAMFKKAAYKANWSVTTNKPGSLKMIE